MALILYVAKIAVDKDTGQALPELQGRGGTIIARGNPSVVPTIYEDKDGSLAIPGSAITVNGDGFTGSFWVEEADLPISWWDGSVEVPLESVEGIAIRLDDLEVLFADTEAAAQAAQIAAETAHSEAATLASGVVRSVNGETPDESGAVTISTGGGGGGAVTSVAGKTGDVSLVKGDVGLAQADNTSDAAKPVSAAQQLALDGKAPVGHVHAIGDTTGLQAALDSKAGVNAAVNASQINAGSGVIDAARLGTGTADETTVLYGDNVYRVPPGGGTGAVDSVNGETGAVVLDAADVGALPDTYTAPVTSVNGSTGSVVLNKSSVGLGNVNNTSDAAKPVSDATQAALDAKAADSAVVKLSGTQTVGGTKTFTSSPVVPDGTFTQAKVVGLVTALASKATIEPASPVQPTGLWYGSQAEYDALGSYSATVVYTILEEV